MKETEEYNGGETVETALGDKIKVAFHMKAVYGFKFKPFVDKFREYIAWMRNQGQMSLDFDSNVVLEDVTIQTDKPSKNRGTAGVVIAGIKCGGANGYTLQSTLFNLAQTKTPVDIKIVIRPKTAKKATGKTKAPAQPGDKPEKKKDAKK